MYQLYITHQTDCPVFNLNSGSLLFKLRALSKTNDSKFEACVSRFTKEYGDKLGIAAIRLRNSQLEAVCGGTLSKVNVPASGFKDDRVSMFRCATSRQNIARAININIDDVVGRCRVCRLLWLGGR